MFARKRHTTHYVLKFYGQRAFLYTLNYFFVTDTHSDCGQMYRGFLISCRLKKVHLLCGEIWQPARYKIQFSFVGGKRAARDFTPGHAAPLARPAGRWSLTRPQACEYM